MNPYGHLHTIERNEKFLLFDESKIKFFEISKPLYDAISELKGNGHKKVPEPLARILENFLFQEPKKQINDGKRTARLRLEISNVCNNRCAYCHVFRISKKHYDSDFLPYEKGKQFIGDFLDLSVQYNRSNRVCINFYGGEPLLTWETIWRLITEFGLSYKDKAIQWTINTNGRLLNHEIMTVLKKYNVELHVGCDGRQEVNDKLRRTENNEGTFQQVQRAFKLANSYGVYKQIDAVISKLNMDKLKDLVDLAAENNIPFIYLDLLYKPDKLMAIEKTAQVYQEAVRYGEQKGVRVGGCCTNLLGRIQSRQTRSLDKYDFLRSIIVAVDGGIYPSISRTKPIAYNSLKDYFSEENPKWQKDFEEIIGEFAKTCRGCFLQRHCYFSGIIQYQYHTKREEGFEDSCRYLREYIFKELANEQRR